MGDSVLKVSVAGIVGISIEAAMMTSATQIGLLFATVHHDALPHSLRRAVWGRVLLTLLLWTLLSVMEGLGLRTFTQENHSHYSEVFVPPLWACILIGGVVSGTALVVSEYVAFTTGCRQIRLQQAAQRFAAPSPCAPNDRYLREHCTLLFGIKEAIGRLQQEADRLTNELESEPHNSTLLLQRVDSARQTAERERVALEAAMEEARRHLTHLPPPMTCDPVRVSAPPSHIILLPFGIRLWKGDKNAGN